MSKTKLALDLVQDLRNLAGSLETLIFVMENHAPEKTTSPQTEPEQKQKAKSKEEILGVKTQLPTLEEVRAKLASLSQDGKQAQVKALITEMGAKKLSDVPTEKFADLLKKAEEL